MRFNQSNNRQMQLGLFKRNSSLHAKQIEYCLPAKQFHAQINQWMAFAYLLQTKYFEIPI